MCKNHARKHFVFYILNKIWPFYTKIRNFNYAGKLETIILISAVNKCLTKYFKNVKVSQTTKQTHE